MEGSAGWSATGLENRAELITRGFDSFTFRFGRVAKRQTQRFQTPPRETSCEFDSHLGYSIINSHKEV